MSVNITIKCDECNNSISDGEVVICENCDKLKLEEISKLEDKIDKLEKLLEKCKANCNTCENRYTCITNNKK